MRQVRAFAFCECGIDVTADSDDLLARACRAPFVRAGRATPSLAIAANGQSLELRSVPAETSMSSTACAGHRGDVVRFEFEFEWQ